MADIFVTVDFIQFVAIPLAVIMVALQLTVFRLPAGRPSNVVRVGCLVLAAGLFCWYKKDAFLKAGTVAMVNSITSELANNPVEGVDTVVVNQVAAGFITKINESEIDLQQFGQFAQDIQRLMDDQAIDADEADRFIDMMVDYYPELGDLLPPEDEAVEDTTIVIDSLEQVD